MTRRSLLTASLLLHAAGVPAFGQEPTNQLLGTHLYDRVLSPVLEVRQLSGEFERWGREMTVTAPNAEVFRYALRTARRGEDVLGGPGAGGRCGTGGTGVFARSGYLR